MQKPIGPDASMAHLSIDLVAGCASAEAVAAGAEANRLATEAMIQARNEGRDYMKEGPDILKKAAKHSAALASALDVWGDITFDFQSTDTLDTVETPTASR